MINKFYAVIAIIILIVVTICCRQNSADTKTTKVENVNLPVTMDDSSRAIIERSIAFSGGYDKWQQTKSVSYDKKSTSYDSTGKIIREISQHYDFVMKPEFRAKISYMLHDTVITYLHDGQKARKLYNGKVSEEKKDIDGAWSSTYGSQFVTCMPFKLKDPGIKAEYVGMVTLSDGVPAQVVKTSYLKGAGSNPDHKWYYYFEPGTGKLLANSLNGKNNYWDFTRYEQFEKAGGLLMPGVRKGYTADTLNSPKKLVSESRNSNFSADKEFAADYFKIPDGK